MSAALLLGYALTAGLFFALPGAEARLAAELGRRGSALAVFLTAAGAVLGTTFVLILPLGITIMAAEASRGLYVSLRVIAALVLLLMGLYTFSRAGLDRMPRTGRGHPFAAMLRMKTVRPDHYLFYGAMLPIFTQPGPQMKAQLAFLALIGMLLSGLQAFGYAAASKRAGQLFSPAKRQRTGRLTGLVLIGVGTAALLVRLPA